MPDNEKDVVSAELHRILDDLRQKYGPPDDVVPSAMRCGTLAFTVPASEEEVAARRRDGLLRCDGISHYVGAQWAGRCPSHVADDIRSRIDKEQQRLAGTIEKIGDDVPAFSGYDPERHPAAMRALEAMNLFASVERPARSVLLSGETGLGKTHLLLASHFARLRRGWPSEYITSGELRPMFRGMMSYDEGKAEISRAAVDRYRLAPVLHIDDLGDVRGSDSFHADFAAGFKGLLDSTKARIAVALNLGSAAAREHPDIGDRVLSRLCKGATVVRMEGEDQRLTGVNMAPTKTRRP